MSATERGAGPAGPPPYCFSQFSANFQQRRREAIPDETTGPFPADGSNGPNVLDDGGVLRSDTTSSVGWSSGVADGVPTSFDLSLVDASVGSALVGAVVYLWHCTADGPYSLYEIENENFLRGVQSADEACRMSFNSIFPRLLIGSMASCPLRGLCLARRRHGRAIGYKDVTVRPTAGRL